MVRRQYLTLSLVLGALIASRASADVFYSNTVPYQPLSGDFVGATFPLLDDVLVNNPVHNPFNLPIAVTRVTYGIIQDPEAQAMSIMGYYGSVSPDSGADADDFPDLNSPITSFGIANVPASSEDEPTIFNAVIGDGITPLFTITPNTSVVPGYGIFALGLLFSAEETGNFWGIADFDSRNDENLDAGFWVYDLDNDTSEAFAEPIPSLFLVTIEGTLVPEPATAGLLGTAGLALLARRRRVA